MIPYLDGALRQFYLSPLRSEAHDYQDYLTLARHIAGQDISARIAVPGAVGSRLIVTEDAEFGFHSGIWPV